MRSRLSLLDHGADKYFYGEARYQPSGLFPVSKVEPPYLTRFREACTILHWFCRTDLPASRIRVGSLRIDRLTVRADKV